MVSSHYFEERVRELRPAASFIALESAESFFTDPPPADALVLSVEEGIRLHVSLPGLQRGALRSGGVARPPPMRYLGVSRSGTPL